MYVETIKSQQRGKVYKSILVREGYREKGKVKHRTMANISKLPMEVIEHITMMLKGNGVPLREEDLQLGASREYGASSAFKELAESIGLDTVIFSRKTAWRQAVMAMIVGRIVYQGSKLGLSNRYMDTCLWELFGYEKGDRPAVEKACYEPLDQLLKAQPRIQKALAKRHLVDGCMILYDITNIWLEGEYEDSELASHGKAKDRRRGYKQVAIGLITDKLGCPVAVEVFNGSTSDQMTVEKQVMRLASEYGISDVIFAGDRGMLTPKRIEEVNAVGFKTLTALTHPQMTDLLERTNVSPELFDERNIAEVIDPEHPHIRYFLCRNPHTRKREQAKRGALIAATKDKLEEIARVKRRRKRDKVAARVGVALAKYRVGKFFEWSVDDAGTLEWQIDQAHVEREEALDGCYVIRTDVGLERMSAEESVAGYHRLTHVEKAFRNLKTVSLEMRPVYHKTDDRIRSHVFLCMLAYYVHWHASQRLQPLFKDDGKGEDRRWTMEGVIDRLKSIRKIPCILAGHYLYDKISQPDDEQKKILDLLRADLCCQ